MSRSRSPMLAILCVSCVLSESALLEVDSSAELVSSLPFVRFALAEHEKKGRIEPHIRGAFLQTPTTRSGEAAAGGQTEVKNATMQSPAAESAEVKQIAVAPADAQATVAAAESLQQPAAAQAAQPLTMVSQPAQLAATEPVAPAAPNQTQQAKLPAPKADVQMAVVPVTVTAKSAAPQALVSHSGTDAGATASKKMSPTTQVAATFSLALIVKILCMLSNVACHVSPLPQVQQFHKLGDTGEADSAPLMSILYSGSQWVFYGNFAYCMTGKSGFLVLVYANITGAILGVYYVWGFQQNCRDQKALQQLQLYCRAAAFVFSLQFLAVWSLSFSSALFFSGLMASLSSIIGACSLCSTLPKVIKTQCSASINLELLIVGICSSMLWVSCGVMLWDAWILLPTLFGLVIQLACGFFVLLFPREDASPAPSRAAAAAAQIRAALAQRQSVTARGTEDYGSTAAGAGTGGTC
ncbi:unnamed protein product [Cladocopium goreaui]|uniref:Sugar transporter SWEET1 n=1 Tax=Cladocopium goreaui TaxID=2562237 RepID=A0A9P1CL91_9DINO|nr:unnamed protein product [Cladocopium goreaui]